MLYNETKKKALAEYRKAVEKYMGAIETVRTEGERLYQTRKRTIELIERVEDLLNSITNKPQEFASNSELIKIELSEFRQTENYGAEAFKEVVMLGDRIARGVSDGVAVGVAGGKAFAEIAPDAALWVATTFGKASTGTAISTLSGAAQKNAALAWIGGGAKAIGGGGIAAGQSRLALIGPIAFLTTFVSAVAIAHVCKNKKQAEHILDKANELTMAAEQLIKTRADISHIHSETEKLLGCVCEHFTSLDLLKECNYVDMSEDEQLQLESLANNTLALAEMLNKVVEGSA